MLVELDCLCRKWEKYGCVVWVDNCIWVGEVLIFEIGQLVVYGGI